MPETNVSNYGERSPRKWEYAFTVNWLLSATHQGLFDLDQLPDEQSLRAQLSSPRAVIRHVLQDMAEVGALQRVRSVGTQAAQPTHRTEMGSAPEPTARDGVEYEFLRSDVVEGNRVSEALFGAANNRLLRILRITHWAGARRAFWVTYLPVNYMEQIDAGQWDQNYREIAVRLGGENTRARYAMTAIGLDVASAALFDVPEFTPALHSARTYYGDNGPILTSFGRIPGLRSVLGFEIAVGS
jgi:DNA-binding GntR family transcriptional regulator